MRKNLYLSILMLSLALGALCNHKAYAQEESNTAVLSFRSLIRLDKEEIPDQNFYLHVFLYQDQFMMEEIALENITVTGANIETIDNLGSLVLDVTDPEGNVTITVKDQKLVNVALSLGHLVKVDISQCPDLEFAEFMINKLTSIDISKNKKLKELKVSTNELTEIDVSANPELTLLDCSYNDLTSLDLSKCSKLTTLYAGVNPRLTSLDVSALPLLELLSAPLRALSDLKVDSQGALNSVHIQCNQISRPSMSLLAQSFPTPTEGRLVVINTLHKDEKNVCWKEDVDVFKSKNWVVIDEYGSGNNPIEYTSIATINSKTNQVRISPNPATDYIHIKSAPNNIPVVLYDAMGAIIYQGKTNEAGELQISTRTFAPGNYLLSIGTNGYQIMIQ